MARVEVKDSKGNKIGMVDDQPKQKLAFDEKGRRIGRFDKQQNKTFDAAGKEIGRGDMIMTKIFKR